MKQIFSLSICFFLIAFSLTSCTAKKYSFDELHRQWMIIEFKNYSKSELVDAKGYLDLSATKSPENQYSAFMGCNRMFMKAHFKGDGKVEFSKVGSTLMACEKNMQLEFDFTKALPTMNRYKIEGHYLTLEDGNGNRMKFIASDWD